MAQSGGVFECDDGFSFYLVNINTVLEKMRTILEPLFFIISYYLIVINKIGVLKRMTAGLTGTSLEIILNNVKIILLLGQEFVYLVI